MENSVKDKVNILISSAGKRVSLTKCFMEVLPRFIPGGKVFTCDMNPEMAPAGYVSDICFKVPRVTDLYYPDLLLKLCLDNHVGMIVPTIDTELLLLSEYKDVFFKHGISIIVANTPFIKVCRDKRNTERFFISHNIRVPKSIDISNPIFPIFAKPYDGSLSQNIHIIRKPEELTPELASDPKLLFMECIDKKIYKEYTVDMYYGKDNLVKCIIPRERIEVRAGEINKGRTAKNVIVPFLKERLNYLEGCVGCICLQLFMNPESGDIVGIEINPRFGGGFPLSYAAGGNFPELLIKEYFFNDSVDYFDSWVDNKLMLRYDEAVYV